MNNVYEGLENLAILKNAKNYNSYLSSIIISAGFSCSRVIDFGAGLGTFAVECRSAGMEVSCVEPDDLLRSKLQEHGFKVYKTIDAVMPESIDYIYTLNVLEHIDDDREALRQFWCRLRPGGKILIYVPAFQWLYSAMDELVGHKRRYTKRGLESLVRETGFHVDEAQYVDSLGALATLAFKWFGNGEGRINQRGLSLFDKFIFPASLLCDRALRHIIGKNVLIQAHRPLERRLPTISAKNGLV